MYCARVVRGNGIHAERGDLAFLQVLDQIEIDHRLQERDKRCPFLHGTQIGGGRFMDRKNQIGVAPDALACGDLCSSCLEDFIADRCAIAGAFFDQNRVTSAGVLLDSIRRQGNSIFARTDSFGTPIVSFSAGAAASAISCPVSF